MELVIWVIGAQRADMIQTQREINESGSMRAVCMLTGGAVRQAVAAGGVPALILMDYEMAENESFATLSMIKQQEAFAGVPLFFMTDCRDPELDEICFEKGAMVVLQRPLSASGILRIERAAWQHEVTGRYEKMLEKQAGDLRMAREVVQLNAKLEARNRLLYQVFGRYFSDPVLERLLEHPEEAVIGGEKRNLTVLMSDLRGFTSLSEELEPEAVTDVLNDYFGRMTEVISRYRGTVIEFLGDGVLAVFGAPLCDENHIEDAIAAGIAMQNQMREVNMFCTDHGYPLLEMGIGIHSGEAFIGNVGSEQMMRYNVVGKVVNECSRIESYSVGGQVLVSGDTLEAVTSPVEVHNRIEIMAKGIRKPVTVCEVTAIGGVDGCALAYTSEDAGVLVERDVLFLLKEIRGKVVEPQEMEARLLRFSLKRAEVVADGDAAVNRLPAIYSDVEILAKTPKNDVLFDHVYAKIVDGKDRRLVLHFTHINHDFRRFAEDMT